MLRPASAQESHYNHPMKIAVPVWQGRVSPVFDVAGQVLLVEWNGAGRQSRREEVLAEQSPDRRAARLAEWGVTTLICCAVSRPLEILLAAYKIQMISQVCGEVEEVLQAFRTGTLESERFAMPGRCRRGRGRGRGRCRRGGRQY